MTGVVEQVASYHSTTLEFAPDGDQSTNPENICPPMCLILHTYGHESEWNS